MTAAGMVTNPVGLRTTSTMVARPGLVERGFVVLTTFLLLHPLPIDWFQTRSQAVDKEGALLELSIQFTLMCAAAARLVGDMDWWLLAYRLDQTLFAFVGLAFLTVLWSADPGTTLRQAAIFAAVTLYGVYLVLRFPLAEILQLLAMMFVASGVVNLAFVLLLPEYAFHDGFWDGVFFQKNALGFSAFIGIPTLIVAGRSRPQRRLVFYGAVPVLFALLLGSQSKTMLVATLASILLLVIYRLFRGRRTLRGAALLSLAAASALTVATATANIALLADWLDKDVSLTGRVPLWESLVPLILERPLTGWGYRATFGGYFSPVHEVWVEAGWDPTHAHNAILQIWVEMGVVAVILFLVTFVRGLARGLQVVNIVPGIIGLWPLMYLSSTLLISITESGVSHSRTAWLLYVVAVLTAAQVIGVHQAGGSAGRGTGDSFRIGNKPDVDIHLGSPRERSAGVDLSDLLQPQDAGRQPAS